MSKPRSKLTEEQIQLLEEYARANPHWDRKSLANLFKNYFHRKTVTTVLDSQSAPNPTISVGPAPPPPLASNPPPPPPAAAAPKMHQFIPTATFALSPHGAAAGAPPPAAPHAAPVAAGNIIQLHGSRLLSLRGPAPQASMPHARDVVSGPLGVYGYFWADLFQLCGPAIMCCNMDVCALPGSDGREILIKYYLPPLTTLADAEHNGDPTLLRRYFEAQGGVAMDAWEMSFAVTVPDGRRVLTPDPPITSDPFKGFVTAYWELEASGPGFWVRTFACDRRAAPLQSAENGRGVNFNMMRKRMIVKEEVKEEPAPKRDA